MFRFEKSRHYIQLTGQVHSNYRTVSTKLNVVSTKLNVRSCPLSWTYVQVSGPFLRILYVCFDVNNFNTFRPNMMKFHTNDLDNKNEMTLFLFFPNVCLNDVITIVLYVFWLCTFIVVFFSKILQIVTLRSSVDGFVWDYMPTFYVINFR